MVKVRSIATFLLTNLGSCPAAAKRRTVTKWTANILADCRYTERGALTREGLSNLCLISVESVLVIVQKICWSDDFSCDAQLSSSR